MKKILFIATILISTITLLFSQEEKKRNENSFESFLNLFPNMNLPFNAMWDSMTYFNVPLNEIPKPLYDEFICTKGIKCESDFCEKKFFYGFCALANFNFSKEFYSLLITIDTEAGCDEKWYIVTYTPKGKLIDVLLIFGKTYFKRPSKYDKSNTYLEFGGIINKDKILTEQSTYVYDFRNELTSEIKKTSEYEILEDGRFKLNSERTEIVK